MAYDTDYEQCAHLYDLFDTKENIEFFFHYASKAGEILDIGVRTGCSSQYTKLYYVVRWQTRKARFSHSPINDSQSPNPHIWLKAFF